MCFENNTDVQCQVSPLHAVSLFQTVNLASSAGHVLSQNLAPCNTGKTSFWVVGSPPPPRIYPLREFERKMILAEWALSPARLQIYGLFLTWLPPIKQKLKNFLLEWKARLSRLYLQWNSRRRHASSIAPCRIMPVALHCTNEQHLIFWSAGFYELMWEDMQL